MIAYPWVPAFSNVSQFMFTSKLNVLLDTLNKLSFIAYIFYTYYILILKFWCFQNSKASNDFFSQLQWTVSIGHIFRNMFVILQMQHSVVDLVDIAHMLKCLNVSKLLSPRPSGSGTQV